MDIASLLVIFLVIIPLVACLIIININSYYIDVKDKKERMVLLRDISTALRNLDVSLTRVDFNLGSIDEKLESISSIQDQLEEIVTLCKEEDY